MQIDAGGIDADVQIGAILQIVPASPADQPPEFKSADHRPHQHHRLGDGIVINLNPRRPHRRAAVAFDDYGRVQFPQRLGQLRGVMIAADIRNSDENAQGFIRRIHTHPDSNRSPCMCQGILFQRTGSEIHAPHLKARKELPQMQTDGHG